MSIAPLPYCWTLACAPALACSLAVRRLRAPAPLGENARRFSSLIPQENELTASKQRAAPAEARWPYRLVDNLVVDALMSCGRQNAYTLRLRSRLGLAQQPSSSWRGDMGRHDEGLA